MSVPHREISVSEEDVVKLMMQFCGEKGFHRSVEALHRESGVSKSFEATSTASTGEIGDAITRGDWSRVLLALQSMALPESKVMIVYEQVLFELLESGERTLAKELLMSTKPLSSLQQSNKAHFNKLYALCYTSERWSASEAYDMGSSKDKRRNLIAEMITSELTTVKPSRLLTLLGHSLKHLQSTGAIPAGSHTYDLFQGGKLPASSQDVDEKVVKSPVAQLSFEMENRIESVAFHPDGVGMAIGGADGFIELRDCEAGQLLEHLPYQAKDQFMRHDQGVMCMAFGGKDGSVGEMLASGCRGGCVKVWKVTTGACLRKFPTAHSGGITSVSFSKEGSQVLSTSLDGTIKCLGIRSGNPLREYRGHSAAVNQACYSADFSRVFSVASDGYLRCWDSKTADCLYEVVPGAAMKGSEEERRQALVAESQRTTIVRVQLAPTGELFVCTQGTKAYLLKAIDGSTLTSYSTSMKNDQKGDLLCGTISAQGGYVYAAAEEGHLYVFDAKTGSVESTVELASRGAGAGVGTGAGAERARETLGVEHHPSRNLLVTFSAAGSLIIWRP